MSSQPKRFQINSHGHLVGPGGMPISTTGEITLGVDALNTLFDLVIDQEAAIAQLEFEASDRPDDIMKRRIAKAKRSLALELGLDPEKVK